MPVFLNRFILLCLCLLTCQVLSILAQQASTEEDRIKSLLDRIDTEKRFVEELTDNNLTNLPVGIKKTVSNTTITIAIDSARITPQGMIIDAFTQVRLPGFTRVITFALRGAVITPAGLSRMGPTRLEMISNITIPLNDMADLSLAADGRNYIEWDCNGFRSVNLSGLFSFKPDIFIPDNPGKSEKVTAGFEVNTTDLNNILVATSITPFRIKGLGDMSFTVRNAVLDMSDYINCEGFALPKDYKLIFPDAPQLWRGFFLKDLSIMLPSELGSSGKRTEIEVKNLLIDDFGISGRFSAENILTIEQGNASGWPFSVSSLEIGIIQNKVVTGEIAGLMGVPFLGEAPLGYAAQVLSGREGLEYDFAVKTTAGEEYPVPFGGKVRLNKGCTIRVHVEDGKFIPSAILNGAFYLSGESASIEGLRFERLQLIAESPYIKGGTFDTSGGAGFSIAGFGLSVDSISLAMKGGKAALGLNARIALMNKTDKGVNASTRLFINASAKKEPVNGGNDKLKWSYDGIILEGVKIKGGVSLFTLKGDVFIYRNHPVYGDGFTGAVGFTAGKIIEDPVEVEIRFGNKTDFRYWYAHINIPTNLTFGAVTLSNMGGGAYSNMVRSDLYKVPSEYLPMKDAGLGLLADVGMHVKTEEIFNADVDLEISTNKSGGLKFIRLGGEGRFLAARDAKTNITKMTASVNMVFDNVNDCFHANLRVFMNIANAIRGRGPEDLLGEAVIHSDPVDWYVFIGRPSCPLGVDVAGLLQAQTYFMAGTKIEAMPLPPAEVSSVISNINMDFMKGERGISSGHGVAFGVRVKAEAGIGKNSGFVYAYFNAGAGADIMLQNYGQAQCEGRDGPIGINGWYASGQGYAYLTGNLGIRIKDSKFDIMSVAAALLVQAKMPNPSWFRGNIAARYSILGGLVKGKVNVAVVLGEECVLVNAGNELGGIKLIGDISPSAGSSDVDVFAAPQVSFNTTIDKEFTMTNLNDATASYRVILDKFELMTSSNEVISAVIEWNPAHDMATLKLRDILPGKQQITATVNVHIEKRNGSAWQPVEKGSESSSVSFGTGDEPKSIPASNVAYSYPLRNQYNFYKDEYPNGYIKLLRGQPQLFAGESQGVNWSYYARFKSSNQTIDIPVAYNDLTSTITYELPKTLSGSAIYEMHILKRPVSSGGIDANLVRSHIAAKDAAPQDSVSIATTDITGASVAETETELHSFSFRTSMYTTFGQKMAKITGWDDQLSYDETAQDRTYMKLLYIKATSDELFDRYETEGGPGDGPLISLQALRGVSWIDNHVHPLIYNLYGTGGLTLNRNISVLGLFPSKAVFLSNLNKESFLLEGTGSLPQKGDFYFMYFVARYVHKDYYELRNKAASLYLGNDLNPTPQALALLAGSLSNLPKDSYPFRLNYRLPGGDYNTFSGDYVFNYK